MGETTWVSEVSDDGSRVELGNGTTWLVSGGFVTQALLWLPTEEVEIIDESTLRNVGKDEAIEVMKIG